MRYHDLGVAAARDVLRHDYGSLLAGVSAQPAAAVARAGRIVRYEGSDRAVVATSRGEELEISSVPLRVRDSAGVERPVSLVLQATADGFAPANPLVPVAIARDLAGGVSVGGAGVHVTLQGQNAAGSQAGDESVFYGDIGPDEDAAISPTANGAELFAVLRSRESPETLRYDVTMPFGAEMVSRDGGAIVLLNGTAIATILPPTATDAQGSPVPTTMTVSGNTLVLQVLHRSLSVAYPVLVDPTVDADSYTAGWYLDGELGGSGPWAAGGPGVLMGAAGYYGAWDGNTELLWWSTGGTDASHQLTEVQFENVDCSVPTTGEFAGQFGCGLGAGNGGDGPDFAWGGESSPGSTVVDDVTGGSDHHAVFLSLGTGFTGTTTYTGPPVFVSAGPILATAAIDDPGPSRLDSLGPGSDAQTIKDPCHPDPVDCATGNQYEQQTNFDLPGIGLGLNLTRTYNSQLAATESMPGPFGYGWTASYSDHLTVDETDGTATVTQADGSTVRFTIDGSSFDPEPWVLATLVGNEDGTYTYTLPNQTSMLFDSSGRLLSESDRFGNATTMTYNDEGELTTVTDPGGRTLTFDYNDDGTVHTVTDPDDHVVTYDYTDGDLTSVTNVVDETWTFGYDDSNQLTSETDPRGETTTTSYDSDNRVVSQTDAMGRTTTWAWPALGETVITDPNGEVTTERFDIGGRLVSLTKTPIAAQTGGFDSPGYYQDSSSNTYTAARVGIVRTSTPGPLTGDPAHSMSATFTGAGSVSSTDTPVTATSGWSLEAWMKPSVSSQSGMVIYDGDDGDGSAANGYGFGEFGSDDHSGDCLAGLYEAVEWLNTGWCGFSPGTWYHVVETNSGGTVTFYVDGSEVWSGSTSTPYTPTGMMIGGYTTGGYDRHFSGSIADAAFYDTALTSTEVTDDYDATTQSALDALIATVSRGLEADFALNEFVAQASLVAGPLTSDPAGSLGVVFDGTTALASTNTPITSTSNWSLEAWMNPSVSSQSGMVIFNGDDGGSDGVSNGYGFGEFGSDDHSGDCLAGLYEAVAWINTGWCDFSPDTWYHVVETNSAGTVTFYVDGSEVWSGSPGTPDAPSGMTIGGYTLEGYDRYFQGSIADAAFYSSALTGAEVADDYDATTQTDYDSLVETGSRDLAFFDPLNETPAPATTTSYTYDSAGDLTSVTDPDGGTTTYTYDSSGNRLTATDPDGRETVWTYDDYHDVLTTTLPGGQVTTTTYNSDHAPTSVSRTLVGTPDHTVTTSYTYEPDGQLATVTDPDGNTTSYGYDSAGDLTSVTDPDGNETIYTYDADGYRLTMVAPKGNVAGADAADYTTTYTPDALGRDTEVEDPDGNNTETGYDGDGNVHTVETANGRTTTTTYDADNEPTEVTYPDSSTTHTVYDDSGDVIAQTNQNDQTTTYAYDTLGHLIASTDPLGRTRTYAYDLDGNQISKTTPDGKTTWYVYDPAGQLLAVDYSDGSTPAVTYSYNDNGQLTGMDDGTGDSSYSYDSLGRMTSTTDGNGATIGYGYDLAGNETSITYPGSHTVDYTYDQAGNMASLTDWLANTTTFNYDPNSNLATTSTTTGLDHSSDFGSSGSGDGEFDTPPDVALDGSGDVWVADAGNDRLEQFTAAGSFLQSVGTLGSGSGELDDPQGVAVNKTAGDVYVADTANNRIEEFTTAGSYVRSFGSYGTANGDLNAPTGIAVDGYGDVWVADTGNDRVEEFSSSGTYIQKVGSAGSGDGELSSPDGVALTAGDIYVADPGNHRIERFNTAGAYIGQFGSSGSGDGEFSGSSLRVATDPLNGDIYATDGGGDRVEAFTPSGTYLGSSGSSGSGTGDYNTPTGLAFTAVGTAYVADSGNNRVETWTAAAGTADANTYDPADYPAATTTTANGSTLSSLAYTYDPDGNLTEETSTGLGSSTQTYGYNSLDQLESNDSNAYTYDGDGNATELNGSGASSLSYNDADQLTSGPAGTYTYNDLGQRTQLDADDVDTNYGYDQAGNLTSVTGGPDSLALSYGYDGNGLLQNTTNDDTTTQLTWDPNTGSVPNLIVDDTTDIIYGPQGLPVEQIGEDDDPIYYHHDQLGSTRQLTNTAGDSIETIKYTPYGAPTIESGTATTNLLYAGQYTDPNSGMVYLRARWYDPTTGQFLSVDPLAADTGATYNYAGDNPTDETDPTGLCGSLSSWGSFWANCGSDAASAAGAVVNAVNPLTYYEDEINSYENGCGYLSSVLYGVEGAAVAATDVAGIASTAAKLADLWGAGDEEVEVTFGHGARHLVGPGLNQGDVEGAIESQIRSSASGAASTGSFWGRVTVDGQIVEYRAYTLPNGTINIGTYYVP
jgi:RHS repeat-associated protein